VYGQANLRDFHSSALEDYVLLGCDTALGDRF